MQINLRGVFLCMKYEIPLMLKQGGGVIVNTSSGAGVKGFKGQAPYAAAKHGVIGLTKSAALDYAQSNILARTAWHSHPLGQALIITASYGWVQREGGPIEEVRPGDVVCIRRARSTGTVQAPPLQ